LIFMKIGEVIQLLERWAPPALQENYDNSRLIVGSADRDCIGVLVCLDCTEDIVQEAIERGCNLVVSHHPILFSPIKTLTGRTYPERTLITAIEHKIALYALHTNLDNVLSGVNKEMADRIGLSQLRILRPMANRLMKLVTYVPIGHLQSVREAIFEAGGGYIGNYDQCSFSVEGTGTFRPQEGTHPYSGKIGQLQEDTEHRLELVFPDYHQKAVLKALQESHPYEEVAFEFYRLENTLPNVGAGMVGLLPEPMPTNEFLQHIKSVFGGMLRFTKPLKQNIVKVAICGGSGSFLTSDAIAAKADVFISSDFKYHQFFDAEQHMMILDIGHFEAEQFTSNLIAAYLIEKIPNFAVLLTRHSTNPVQYL